MHNHCPPHCKSAILSCSCYWKPRSCKSGCQMIMKKIRLWWSGRHSRKPSMFVLRAIFTRTIIACALQSLNATNWKFSSIAIYSCAKGLALHSSHRSGERFGDWPLGELYLSCREWCIFLVFNCNLSFEILHSILQVAIEGKEECSQKLSAIAKPFSNFLQELARCNIE